MPEMTGVTLINEIRGLRPEQKIILCSGLGSNGNIKEKIPGKVVAYLTKPVSRSDYAKVLSRILNEDI
jgi:YesN/AraC family two-component response regulator